MLPVVTIGIAFIYAFSLSIVSPSIKVLEKPISASFSLITG
jgi:hypothetical protein